MIMSDVPTARRRSTRFWRWVFLSAGTLGLIELVPLYFAENTLSRAEPPALTHPEFYYGFIGVAVAWQLAFIVMASDPVRYRPMVPAALCEKFLYVASIYALYAAGRVHGLGSLLAATVDVVWLVLFAVASARTRNSNTAASRDDRGRATGKATVARVHPTH